MEDRRSHPLRGQRADRADHLQKVLAALHVYVAAITADLAQNIPATSVDRLYLDQLFEQFSSDALRVIRNAAAEVRVRQNWRAS